MSRKNRRKKAKNMAAAPAGMAGTAAPKKKKGPVHGLDTKTWVLYLVGFAALAWSYFVLFTRNWSDVGFAFTVLVTLLWPWSLYKNWKKGPKKR
ncbi:MAG: hypothetical protein ACI4N8_04330 [Megasphaera sp.]|uniref:hypothetical protein n=1 Tax=Megasphaera sp. TaxID=2023260 RepID=UPI003EFE452D